MKKTMLLSCLMCLMAVCSKAQLTVKSSGVIETSSTLKMLGKSSQGYSGQLMGSMHGMLINNNGKGSLMGNNERKRMGLHIINTLSNDTTNIGVFVYPDQLKYTNTNEYGIISCAGHSTHGSYGVYGGFFRPDTVVCGAGIYGSTSSMWIIPQAYRAKYAGFFYGNVRVVAGTLTATVVTPSAMLSRISSNEFNSVQALPVNDVSEKLGQVQLLQLNRTVEIENEVSDEPVMLENGETKGGLKKTALFRSSLAKTGYGLAADQLREVYPELVYEDQNGNVSINYIEMIPLLVQANNELRARVQALEQTQQKTKGSFEATEEQSPSLQGRDEEGLTLLLSLGQNDPNPFSEQTSIEVNVPESVTSAALLIFDMQGKQVRKIDIADRGTSRITVTGQGLPEGMYLYSLVADGKVVKTRKMILSK